MLSKTDALQLIIKNPVFIAHKCGFDKLRDFPHADWIRKAVFAKEDFHITAHRNSYKTTAIDMVGVALRLILYPNQNGMIFRKTDDKVLEVIRGIKQCLNAPIMQILFNAIWETESGFTYSSNANNITLSHYCRVGGATQLSAHGFLQPITSAHADWIFTDDISNLLDSDSVASREWTKLNFLELKNIITPGGLMGHSNTPWHADDVRILMPKPQEFDCYSTGLMSKADIAEKKKEFETNPKLFACNYELKFIADESALFGKIARSGIDAFDTSGTLMYIDPAFSPTGHDYTAIGIISETQDERLAILGFAYREAWNRIACENGGIEPDPVDSRLAKMIQCYGVKKIAVETNSLGELPQMVLRNFGVPVVSVNHAQMGKHRRIETAATVLKELVLIETENTANRQFVRQVLDYNEDAEFRDSADCLAGLIEQVLPKLFKKAQEKAQ
jgi:hypothetical protein